MKKTAAVIITAALVVTLGGTTAFAFGRSGQTGSQNSVARSAYTRYNQYSECTYCGGSGHRFTDADGDGVCDNYAAGSGIYRNDADGDGVCDYYTADTSDTDLSRGYARGASGSGQRSESARYYNGTGNHAGHRYGHR